MDAQIAISRAPRLSQTAQAVRVGLEHGRLEHHSTQITAPVTVPLPISSTIQVSPTAQAELILVPSPTPAAIESEPALPTVTPADVVPVPPTLAVMLAPLPIRSLVNRRAVQNLPRPQLAWIRTSPRWACVSTAAIQGFLRKIPANALKNVEVTAFDTRFSAQEQGMGLRFLMRILGYAAERIVHGLQGKGGHLATPPAGFIVEGKEGPLQEDELERAANWGSAIGRATNNLQYA